MDDKQAADLLWQEWKYRHDLFWKSLFRWAGAVLTLWIIPFVKPEVFKPWPKLVLAFPVTAFLLSMFSAWIIGAEHRRFAAVNTKFNEMRRDYSPPRMPTNSWLDRRFASPVGVWIIPFYGFTFALISVLIAILLWRSIPT